jgi:hypothetical protein
VVALVVALAATAAACGGGSDGQTEPTGPTLANGPKFVKNDPCSLLSDAQVGEVFGEPVTVDPTNGGSPLTTDCAYIVGDPATPVGRLDVNVVFPAIGAGEGADALSVVESDRANAQIAGPGVFDLDVGEAGFLQSSRSVAEFVVSPKLAVSLQWYPTGGPPEGSPVTDEVEAGLTTLATDISTRLG